MEKWIFDAILLNFNRFSNRKRQNVNQLIIFKVHFVNFWNSKWTSFEN